MKRLTQLLDKVAIVLNAQRQVFLKICTRATLFLRDLIMYKESLFVKAAQKKVDSMAALKETLNDSQKEFLEGYIEAQGDIEAITRYDTYVATLKFGILLMVEGFVKGGAENE